MSRALVLLRHGQSIWNHDNLFTGWTDVDLNEEGREEARHAGRLLKADGFVFDAAWTSVLTRAIRTLWIVLEENGQLWLPVHRSWRLNERHYGALQGLNKADTAARYGDEQVRRWRRSYDERPPLLEMDDERHPRYDPRYRCLKSEELPVGESLADTVRRVIPLWKQRLAPEIRRGRNLLVVAHGNSLRGLIKYLEDIPDEEIVHLEIPTGVPMVYELSAGCQPLRRYTLGVNGD